MKKLCLESMGDDRVLAAVNMLAAHLSEANPVEVLAPATGASARWRSWWRRSRRALTCHRG